MLPWFISLLISLGHLTSTNQWQDTDSTEQQRLELIVTGDTIP